jgi:anti-sigma regulatory factor (Ser/Thr protein kinase)
MQPPYASRVAHVHANIGLDRAEFVIRDEGPGFDIRTVPSPRSPETIDQSAGRGLVLMTNFMDEVRFNATGNEVTMVMLCKGCDESGGPAVSPTGF